MHILNFDLHQNIFSEIKDFFFTDSLYLLILCVLRGVVLDLQRAVCVWGSVDGRYLVTPYLYPSTVENFQNKGVT